MKSAPELETLMHVTSELYREYPQPQNEVDNSKLLTLADMNRVLYYFILKGSEWIKTPDAKTKLLIKNAKKKGDLYVSQLTKTVLEIENVLGYENYLLLKTFKGYPHITHDVDILVKDLDSAIDKFKKKKFKIEPVDQGPFKKLVTKKGLIEISIHEKVSWGGVTVMEKDFPWANPRSVEINGVTAPLPNINADLISIIAHVPFEKLHFPLGDLLYIYNNSNSADWNEIENQAKKNNWAKTFYDLLSILNGLHRGLYQMNCPIEEFYPQYRKLTVALPFEYPLNLIIKAHIEKKAWNKVFSFKFYIKDRIERFLRQRR